MRNKAIKRIIFELVKYGSLRHQALAYVRLIKQFEEESKGKGDRHHILPRGVSRWKKYSKCNWNLVTITWPLHISLHAYLTHVFPENEKLIRAVKATTVRLKTESEKKKKYKNLILRMYSARKSPAKIAERIGVSTGTIWNWLFSWDVKTRDTSESKFHHQKDELKEKVIKMYVNEISASQIGAKLSISHGTIQRWLVSWGIPVRSHLEAGLLNPKKKSKEKIIGFYQKGKSIADLARKFNVLWETMKTWLLMWGVKLRSRPEATRLYHWGKTCRTSI